MDTNDNNMLADFGYTDSVFWKNRLAKKGWPPLEHKEPATSVPPPGLYEDDATGIVYRSDGKKLTEVKK